MREGACFEGAHDIVIGSRQVLEVGAEQECRARCVAPTGLLRRIKGSQGLIQERIMVVQVDPIDLFSPAGPFRVRTRQQADESRTGVARLAGRGSGSLP